MNKTFLLSNKQAEVENAEGFYGDLEVTLCPLVFGIIYLTLRSQKRNIHRQHQISALFLDPENCQKNADCVRYRGIELGNELLAPEEYRGRGAFSPIVRYRSDTFHRARCS